MVDLCMNVELIVLVVFIFQAEDGIRDGHVTGVQTCALPISVVRGSAAAPGAPTSAGSDVGRSDRPVEGEGRPISTRTTLGRPGVSLVPAPTPSAAVVSAGCGPACDARPRISATPVGVASSPMPGATPLGTLRPPCS